jgi:hypothetical protein
MKNKTYLGLSKNGQCMISGSVTLTPEQARRFNSLPEPERLRIAARALAGSGGIRAEARDAQPPAVAKVYDRLDAFRRQHAGGARCAPARMHQTLDKILDAHFRRRKRAEDGRVPDDQVCFDSAPDDMLVRHAAALAKATDAGNRRWAEKFRKHGTAITATGVLPL